MAARNCIFVKCFLKKHEKSTPLQLNFECSGVFWLNLVTLGCEYGCKSSYKSETTKQAYNQQEDGSFSTYLYGLDPLLLSRVQVVDGELNMEKLASGNYILEGAYVGTRGGFR